MKNDFISQLGRGDFFQIKIIEIFVTRSYKSSQKYITPHPLPIIFLNFYAYFRIFIHEKIIKYDLHANLC